MDAHQNDSDSSAGGGGGGGVLAAIKSTFKKGKRASVDGEKEGSKHLDKGSVPLAKGSVPLAKGSMPLSPPSETDTDADDDSRRAGKVVPIIAPPGTRHGEATISGMGRGRSLTIRTPPGPRRAAWQFCLLVPPFIQRRLGAICAIWVESGCWPRHVGGDRVLISRAALHDSPQASLLASRPLRT